MAVRAAEISLFARPAAVLAVIPIAPGLFRLVSHGPEPEDLLPEGANVQEEVWRSAFRISYRQVRKYLRFGSALPGGGADPYLPPTPLDGRCYQHFRVNRGSCQCRVRS